MISRRYGLVYLKKGEDDRLKKNAWIAKVKNVRVE